MTAEILDYGPQDAVTIGVSWLTPLLTRPLFAGGAVANTRRAGDPLPFIWVNYMDGNENVDESTSDEVLSIHTLFPKGNGDAAAIRNFRDGADEVHRRMLLLAVYLEDVALPGGRVADIESVKVFTRPRTEEYGDEQILHKVARYQLGLSYAKLS